MNSFPPSLVIVDGVRTPFAKMGTSFAGLDAVELGRAAVTGMLARTGIDPGIVNETIMGCVSQPADAANVARVIALRSGIPKEVPAMTVHRNCASGLEAITAAAGKAAVDQGEVFVVGGTESMSRIPMLFRQRAAEKFSGVARAKSTGQRIRALTRFRPRDFSPIVALRLGLTDPVAGLNMGETAEVLSREYGISREEQDRFALRSHLRAAAAEERLNKEIMPVYPADSPPEFVTTDNGVRQEQSMQALERLRPVFDRKTGTVTPGNSSQITDGAVALLAMTERRAADLGVAPLGRLVDFACVGCDPRRMGMGSAYALQRLVAKTNVSLDSVDVLEINEAFATQVLAVLRELETSGYGFDPARLNPNGGSIALGHPVGASGARLVLTALKELERTGGRRAVVSLCVGGGQGVAALFERF